MTMQSRQIVMMALVLTGPVISGASAGIVFDGSGDPADVGFFPIDPGGIINTPRAGAIAGDGLTFYQNDAVGSVARRDICAVNIWACPEDARSPDIEGELDNGAGYFVEFRFEAVDNGVSAFGWGGFAGLRDTSGFQWGFVPNPNDGALPDSIGVFSWITWEKTNIPINPGEFNTVRMTMPPGGGTEMEFSVNGGAPVLVEADGGDSCCAVLFGNGGDNGLAEIY